MYRVAITIILASYWLSAYANGEFFSQPAKLCSALSQEGLETGGWVASKAFPGEWLCMTSLISFGAIGANGLANNIAFYVNGTSTGRANDIRVKINVNNASERDVAFERLRKATKALFAAIGQPMPRELGNALKKQAPVSTKADFGSVELIREPGKIDSFLVVLTDTKFIAAKEESRKGSADDFDSCKAAVARAAGYPATLVSGDGDPVEESGYKSFMIEGRGKDLFFCEVYPGRRYKIKAAINGAYPFKYIAEGTF
jgi:hypothetical protein